jgi:hypothetical protein
VPPAVFIERSSQIPTLPVTRLIQAQKRRSSNYGACMVRSRGRSRSRGTTLTDLAGRSYRRIQGGFCRLTNRHRFRSRRPGRCRHRSTGILRFLDQNCSAHPAKAVHTGILSSASSAAHLAPLIHSLSLILYPHLPRVRCRSQPCRCPNSAGTLAAGQFCRKPTVANGQLPIVFHAMLRKTSHLISRTLRAG